MGKIKTLLLASFLALFTGELAAHSVPDVLASYHFAGTTTIGADKDAANVKKAWELPESVKFRAMALDKVASYAITKIGGKGSPELIRPLLDDILASESLMELRRGSNGLGEFIFAIHLNKDRAQLWQKNLSSAFSSRAQSNAKPATNGWEIVGKTSPNIIRFATASDWVVIGAGDKSLPLHDNLLQLIKRNGRPAPALTNWLHADIDFPALQKWCPLNELPLKPARTTIDLSPRLGDMRTSIRAVYPESLNWHFSPWQYPQNLIGDPLVSFTVMQNPATFLKTPPQFTQLGFNPLTNQVFLWAQSAMPFFSFVAMPTADAAKTLNLLCSRAPAAFNPTLAQRKGGELACTNDMLIWKGLSVMRPELHKDRSNKLIYGGLVSRGSTNAPPRELLDQALTKTNVIYYDWELSAVRMNQWVFLSKALPIFQHGAVVPPPPVPGGNRIPHLPDEQWQVAITPLLGNTVTEVAAVGDKELQFTRKSVTGFTAVELLYLTHWLASPDFPHFTSQSTAAKPAPRKK